MSTSARKPATGPGQAQAEVVLLPHLRNCLLNLPAALVAVLLNSNTIAQNVVVELSYRVSGSAGAGTDQKQKPAGTTKSLFLGWTGMQSQSRLAAPGLGRDGGRGSSKEQTTVPAVELDATFGRLLGLSEGMKVGITLHLEPPQAHTVNIEPLTATDWEIIELHAHFLEMNFLSQVRALPSPAAGQPHPLTLHLTPTSTANILVTSLLPAPSQNQAFVKISPDAEVIVAPKTRQSAAAARSSAGGATTRDSRSVASTSRRSEGGRSAKSTTARHRSTHDDEKARPPLYLRAVTRSLQNEWFEDGGDEMRDEGLKVWLDREHLYCKTLRGVTFVTVSIIRPAGLQEPIDPLHQPTPESLPAQKVVAKLAAWDDAPDSRHAALSSSLCAVLDADGVVGGIVRIDPAPSPLPKTASALKDHSQQAAKDAIVKKLRITPFVPTQTAKKKQAKGFSFGGESKAEREEAVQRIRAVFGKTLLEGPLTEGMLLPAQDTWPGGILDFEPTPSGDPHRGRANWLIGGDRKLEIVVQAETAPSKLSPLLPGENLAAECPTMVGIDEVIAQTKTSLLHSSSVLVTGTLGAGKSSLAQLVAHQLRNEYLFTPLYVSCRNLVSEETRAKTIKEHLHRLFASAQWAARLGGRALVVLDDLDRLCPVETELQVDANGRSRQISELLCSIAKQFCGRDKGVVLLATAQGKEALNTVFVGGHVVRDFWELKAPGKEGRRKVLELLVGNSAAGAQKMAEGRASNGGMGNAWMEGDEGSRPTSADGPPRTDTIKIDPELDLLDIAGQTDGYMPGDMHLLVSRARSEALIRSLSFTPTTDSDDAVILNASDFASALKGFTPASLRGVTLHASTTTFASIGGLTQTRATLLETLQYPTTYAPLFAKCPLRLRSGLLLYGYPGCGKTLLASAVAGECGLNFISVKGPEILNKYIGASEKSVRDLFARAQAARPAVLFFDEFDSIAPRRGHDSTGVTDRVVNMLLTMMDGAEGLQGVYVLAATSRPDLIDPALLRPGRLDRSLICDMPDLDERLDILRAVGKKLKVEETVFEGVGRQTLGEVAERTEGYSGADLQAVLYNAHLEAIHDVLGADAGAQQDFGGKKKNGTEHGRRGRAQDFTYFRLRDDDDDDNAGSTPSPAAVAAERAQIAAQLSALHLARRKAKAERHASQTRQNQRPGSSAGAPIPNGFQAMQKEEDKHPRTAEPIIIWRHLEKSLQTSRPSISGQERERLGRVYREFISGRSGEMADGQGPTEVGGRTSLM
ncbi:Peroxisome biosynthesis protein pex1 [Recurvomyces mirabilis]|uniref:Peroxisomal ATPase PEX1 n=1 Tax=Recurvomyces mirabilis TaxID=574656 RepID=A0AAE0WTV1_9PEZI|nr:Peroxisome biosynthesis protein pex1 [Recurvomyces mirabilis]KAK5157482.1 Peroxisome biosynthesis protein pex1 [Recurvomyces mirabilis]